MKMAVSIYVTLLLTCAWQVLSGCSRNPGRKLEAAVPESCQVSGLTASDLQVLLREPIVGSRSVPGDPQTCEFITAGYPSVTVTVRPSRGRSTVAAWAAGKMPLAALPLPAVGESAVWQPDLREVIAQDHDRLCDIEVRAAAGDLPAANGSPAQILSTVCNRIFGAR
jgi:hypothetical protein